MKYSLDKRVSFDSKTHSYFLGKKRLTSVTTLLSKFKNEFDSDYWSKVIAKRENTTQEEILFKWKRKAFKSTEIGTAIHKIFEDYVENKFAYIHGELVFEYNKLETEFLDDFNKKKIQVLIFINDFFITNRIVPVYTEHIVYDENLAGQIDMICKDSQGNYYILDFKTNEKIDFKSYKSKKMLSVFDFIEDCSYYHYCIQLSIYKKLLKDIDIRKIFLVHITTENYHFIECKNILENIELNELI